VSNAPETDSLLKIFQGGTTLKIDDKILDEAVVFAESTAREAGTILMDFFGKEGLQVSSKSSGVDLVTEADRRAEQIIMDAMRHRFPDHGILSEEADPRASDSEWRWVVDPLDGTTNFTQGFPLFCVSIALQHRGKSVVGIIYVPVLDRMSTAASGKGAFVDGKKVYVSRKKILDQCVLATGFPYDRAAHPENNAEYFARMVPLVRGLRRTGSAAYDLSLVAAGVFDGFWELNLSLWDVAAGTLLVEEAGGEVNYLTEKRGVSLIAGNKDICGIIRETLF
jgi:myo-inositol-1(or 4)-monophosphatase